MFAIARAVFVISLAAVLVACLDLEPDPIEGTGTSDDTSGDGVDAAPDDTSPGPDASTDPATGNPDAGSQVACDDPVQTNQSGEHNPGRPCLKCHDGGGGEAPTFTLGGTLYSDTAGTAPVTGATIRVIDANGEEITMVSARNGNFWTSQQMAFPVQVRASRCPDTQPMSSPVDQAGGDCNQAGCHDADFRVHLP
jgi:hypothetical protein